jgi:tight adherence protein C
MTHEQLVILSLVGGGILALIAAALLLFSQGAGEQEIARRIGGLHRGTAAAQPRSSYLWSAVVSLTRSLGDGLRERMLSARDAEALAKTLASSGLQPSKAMPIFVTAKIACLFGIPALVYFGTVLLGYPTTKQLLYAGLSLVVGMMLPNWVIGLLRRPYQAALRRGIPDALDLLVVCAEAGLGLDSAIDRVAREMQESNRPVGIELSLLSHEMRILPDRRVALANLAERTGQPALRRLSGAQTLKYGTPLSQGLRSLAAEMRDERMIQFEERAGKLPALLVVPMILLIMPCLFIIMMGQPVSQLMGTLHSMHP